ncbi:hypothetical protein [Nocardia sp. XZ_19_369]|uniref:poly(ethylene terephthalate) hydrolase family protein n=1 Tax=Nocardia sp. XZ_19_369 TaxID=2769487 RepID=UPI00188E557A|nr:hypothetical protein [Nocardia sp. XZ_19_369]
MEVRSAAPRLPGFVLGVAISVISVLAAHATAAHADPDTQDLDTLFGGLGSHQVVQTAATVACPGPGALSGENMVVPRRCQGTFPFGSGSPVGVQYYYPADIDQVGKAPAIVFSPGILTDPGFYDAMLRQWASYGFVVAVSFDYLNTLSEMQFVGLAGLKERDLDPASPLAGRIDFGRIVLAGQSAGGGSALLAANIAPWFHAIDPTFRVVGSLAMQPGPLAATNFVPTPTLIIQNGRDSVVPAGSWVDWYQYPALGAAPAFVATRKAVTHTDVENALLALNAEHSLAVADVNGGKAYAVAGPILAKWGELGWEHSTLGYPTSNEYQLSTGGFAVPLIGYFGDTPGRWSKFQHGVIYWSAGTGAHPVSGGIYDSWSRAGFESGAYGYPVGDEYPTPDGGVAQHFQRGTLTAAG